jgi:hypothetical protein
MSTVYTVLVIATMACGIALYDAVTGDVSEWVGGIYDGATSNISEWVNGL